MTVIGFDFGTGNSVLATWQGGGSRVFESSTDAESISSDILISDTELIDPEPAHLHKPPAGFRRESAIKRRLLSLFQDSPQERTYLVDLAAARIRYLYDAYLGIADDAALKAVLTCPANTGQAYRDILLEIGRRVGLPQVDIVDEPTAAAVHHGLSEVASHNERWMVVDWGCGTCDVSLIERQAGKRDLLVKCVHGDNHLGGMDMDVLLRDLLADRYGFDPAQCPSCEVEDVKKRLSEADEITAALSLSDGSSVEVTAVRDELEALIAPLLARAAGLVKSALEEARWGDVDHVIATGGPILMPSVRRTIAEAIEWHEEDLLCADPLTSVAQGAARLAEWKRVGGLVVTNQVAQTIGVRVVRGENDDAYHPIIKRGETRPVTREVLLATSVDLQDVIAIELREGDNVSAQSNRLLGRIDVIVRPENQKAVRVKLGIRLSDSGAMEALVEPVGDPNTVRQVHKMAGLNIAPGTPQASQAELRLGDPVEEFRAAVGDHEIDPDTARQVYERIKIKYHPDRQPERRDHWSARLAVLDGAFNAYLAEIERRIRATTLPDLPWSDPKALDAVVVDEVLAQRLTHCLAQEIGGTDKRPKLVALLKRFPDYRRVLASYLSTIKRNPVLQGLLSTDGRPHVGLVVLLQNLPDKPIRERHEVLKAAYRLPGERAREMLDDPQLDVEALYEQIPKEAPAAVNPITGQQVAGAGATPPHVELQFEYRDGNTYISGQTYPVKERLKQLGCRWDGKNKVWYATGKHLTEKDVWPDA